MSTSGNKKGYITVSNELIADMLELPHGAVITGVLGNYIQDSTTFFVKGYGHEVTEGQLLQEIPHVIFRKSKIQEIET